MVAALRERIRQIIKHRRAQAHDSVVTGPDGKERRFESVYYPELDRDGRVIAVNIVSHDVSDQARTSRETHEVWAIPSDDLSMTRDRLGAIVAAAPLLITIQDLDSTLRYLNHVPEGLDPTRVLGSRVAEWLTDESKKAMEEAFAKVVSKKEVVEYRAHALSGRLWLTRLAPLMHEGEVRQILACALDITEQVRLEAQLWQSQKVESLGTMAGGIAHDFNNLLTSIMNNTELTRRWVEQARDPRPFLENIENAAQKAADLCEQMLTYAGRNRARPGPSDLNRVITDMARLTRAAVSPKIDTVFDLAEQLPPSGCGSARLSQVVLNLINNAADSMEGGHGRITVRTDCLVVEGDLGGFLPAPPAPGRYVRLRVADTGRGMDSDELQRIFDPFYTTKDTGHGLGLSAVLGIVSSNRGGLAADSRPGLGTTMTVLLPVHEGEPLGGLRAAIPGTWTRPRDRSDGAPKELVMVVDDDAALREILSSVLLEAGYEVSVAADGDKALAMLQASERPPTAIVLDVTMPRRDGYSTLAKIREQHRNLPVVLSSGKPLQPIADPHVRLLPKPYGPEGLIAAIEELTSS